MSPLRTLDQSSKLKDVLYEIRGQALVEADRLENDGHTILKLNTGNPAVFGFDAPFQIVRDMIEAVPHAHGYSDSRGIMSARRAVVYRYEQDPTFPPFGPDDVYLGNGVSELITMVMQALLDEGDEVLIPAPDYPLWTAMTSLGGGTPVHYLADEQNGWQPDLEDIRAKVTPRTKAIVVINPNNPTGAVYSREVLEGIADDRARELAARALRRDLRPHPVRRRRAHSDGLDRARPAGASPSTGCRRPTVSPATGRAGSSSPDRRVTPGASSRASPCSPPPACVPTSRPSTPCRRRCRACSPSTR